ncbi:hypothetical protein [Chryseobacterium rhizosphaerae]|uniref:hypothetical protein n=1 Tax=Chryseobacterium rhizosphaerae TaxID=395937 RepID=UPI003D12D8EF
MKDKEYIILSNMLEKNKHHYKKGNLEFQAYLENHRLIMKKIKNNIVKMDQNDMDFLSVIENDDSVSKFKQGILILRCNLN